MPHTNQSNFQLNYVSHRGKILCWVKLHTPRRLTRFERWIDVSHSNLSNVLTQNILFHLKSELAPSNFFSIETSNSDDLTCPHSCPLSSSVETPHSIHMLFQTSLSKLYISVTSIYLWSNNPLRQRKWYRFNQMQWPEFDWFWPWDQQFHMVWPDKIMLLIL